MDKYHVPILNYLQENGESGVNAIAKAIDVPLSTVQKYLERQSYFRKTLRRKWDLPERVEGEIEVNIETTQLALLGTSLETQALLMETQFEKLQSAFTQLRSQLSTIKPMLETHKAPVAGVSNNIDKRLNTINEYVEKIHEVFKRNKNIIPDNLKEILFNFDYVGLVLKEGAEYTNNFLQGEVYELLAGKIDKLSDDTIEILKENQK